MTRGSQTAAGLVDREQKKNQNETLFAYRNLILWFLPSQAELRETKEESELHFLSERLVEKVCRTWLNMVLSKTEFSVNLNPKL